MEKNSSTQPPEFFHLCQILTWEFLTSEYLCSNSYNPDCVSLLLGFHSFASEQGLVNQFSSYLELTTSPRRVPIRDSQQFLIGRFAYYPAPGLISLIFRNRLPNLNSLLQPISCCCSSGTMINSCPLCKIMILPAALLFRLKVNPLTFFSLSFHPFGNLLFS